MSFEMRDPEIEQYLRMIGGRIAKGLPINWGFTLLLFEFGDGGSTFYLSNAKREDMIVALQEFIEHQQGEEGGARR